MNRSPLSHVLARALATGLLACLAAAPASGQGKPGGSVQLQVTGGAVALSLTAAVPGAGITPVENTATRLRWGKPPFPSKIVVSTDCPGQSYSLAVEAVSVVNGLGTGLIDLFSGMSPMDLVIDMPADARGDATLRYVASATVEQGSSLESGDDVHAITFTLVSP